MQRDDDPLPLRESGPVAEQAAGVLDVDRRSRRVGLVDQPPVLLRGARKSSRLSASERHVRMAGRGSSAARAAAGIGVGARSIRNSMAFASARDARDQTLRIRRVPGRERRDVRRDRKNFSGHENQKPPSPFGPGVRIIVVLVRPGRKCRQGIRPTGLPPATTSSGAKPSVVIAERSSRPEGRCQGRRRAPAPGRVRRAAAGWPELNDEAAEAARDPARDRALESNLHQRPVASDTRTSPRGRRRSTSRERLPAIVLPRSRLLEAQLEDPQRQLAESDGDGGPHAETRARDVGQGHRWISAEVFRISASADAETRRDPRSTSRRIWSSVKMAASQGDRFRALAMAWGTPRESSARIR